MEVKVQMPFQQLVEIVKQLSPAQKAKLQKELITDEHRSDDHSKISFTDFLLKGPVFSEEQLKIIEETHQSINEWRTK